MKRPKPTLGLRWARDPSRNALVDWLWPFVCANQPDNDDLQVNPVAKGAPSLAQFGGVGGFWYVWLG